MLLFYIEKEKFISIVCLVRKYNCNAFLIETEK